MDPDRQLNTTLNMAVRLPRIPYLPRTEAVLSSTSKRAHTIACYTMKTACINFMSAKPRAPYDMRDDCSINNMHHHRSVCKCKSCALSCGAAAGRYFPTPLAAWWRVECCKCLRGRRGGGGRRRVAEPTGYDGCQCQSASKTNKTLHDRTV